MSKKDKAVATDKSYLCHAFIEYLRSNGKRPSSLGEFCRTQKIALDTVKVHFKTLTALEKAVWRNWFEETISVLRNSAEYAEYSARERLLSFYYTWMETVKPSTDYLKIAPVLLGLYSGLDWFLTEIQHEFLKYAREIVQLAITNEEIMKRPVLQNYYDKALWQQFLFVMNYWIKDKSEEQTKTDEAIERSVNLFFELAGRSQFDALVDFGKFLLKGNK